MKEQIIEYNGKKYKVIEVIEDFKTIKFKGKEFRVYECEDKPVGDFLKKMPKGFELAEHSDFIELFDNQLIDYPEDLVVYFVKHYSKRKQKEGYLSSCYLGRYSLLYSDDSVLSGSYGSGRVLVVKK